MLAYIWTSSETSAKELGITEYKLRTPNSYHVKTSDKNAIKIQLLILNRNLIYYQLYLKKYKKI